MHPANLIYCIAMYCRYMVVDLNRFLPSEKILSGFLWVVEQVRD